MFKSSKLKYYFFCIYFTIVSSRLLLWLKTLILYLSGLTKKNIYSMGIKAVKLPLLRSKKKCLSLNTNNTRYWRHFRMEKIK